MHHIKIVVYASPEVFAKVLLDYEKEENVDEANHTMLISKGKYTQTWADGDSREGTYTYKNGMYTTNYIDDDGTIRTNKFNVTVSKNELIIKSDNTEEYDQDLIEDLFLKYKNILKDVDIDQVKVNKVITSQKYIRQ